MRAAYLLCLVMPALAGDPVSLNVSGLSLMPEPWNKEANLRNLEHHARKAAQEGAQLILTPEGFLEGYIANSKREPQLTRERYLSAGENIDGAMLTRIRSLARELKVYLGVGFAERRGDQMFNTFAVFAPDGGLTLRYVKAHNADDEPFNTTGVEFPVVDTPLGKWGALICFDRQLPETSRLLAVKGAQIILVPSYGSYGDLNDAMMRTRAAENGVWVVFVHPRRVLIIDPRGKVAAQDDRSGRDQIVSTRIELDARVGSGPIRSRKPDLYRELLRVQ